MSVLINGMEMPKNCEIVIRIDEEGEVYIYDQYPTKIYKAIPVPPHGRLIDADALLRTAMENFDFVPRWMVKEAPTVIPADEDGET